MELCTPYFEICRFGLNAGRDNVNGGEFRRLET